MAQACTSSLGTLNPFSFLSFLSATNLHPSYCVDESGEDVQAESESDSEETGETHEHEEEETTNNNQHCHFHAGVE